VSAGSQCIAKFVGGVSCRRDAESPLGLTLIGRTAQYPDEGVTLAFAASAPVGLPEVLEDPIIERLDASRFRIRAAEREWMLAAPAFHLHRDVTTPFYRAIAPRAVPWSKRLFWRLILSLAASSAGKRLLVALRGR